MNSPFEGISEIKKNKLFKLLESHTYNFNKNEDILSLVQNENNLCILLDGCIEIININTNGDENLVESLYENSIFGNSISIINPIDQKFKIVENSKVLVVNYNQLLNTKNLGHSYYNLFIQNLFNIINTKLKDKNSRIRILTKKTIRDRLLAFFDDEYLKNHSKHIYLSSSFKNLADYLAVNRSSMFRELKSLKEEGFIKIDGKRITLLYTPSV